MARNNKRRDILQNLERMLLQIQTTNQSPCNLNLYSTDVATVTRNDILSFGSYSEFETPAIQIVDGGSNWRYENKLKWVEWDIIIWCMVYHSQGDDHLATFEDLRSDIDQRLMEDYNWKDTITGDPTIQYAQWVSVRADVGVVARGCTVAPLIVRAFYNDLVF